MSEAHTALVILHVNCQNGSNGDGCFMSFALSGATTLGTSDNRAIGWAGADGGLTGSGSASKAFAAGAEFVVTLNSGTTTITANYKAVGGGTATFTAHDVSVVIF